VCTTSSAISGSGRREAASTGFLLPDRPNDSRAIAAPDRPITWTKYVAVDPAQDVRGGFLLMKQPAVAGGREVRVANYQAPISEGVRDRGFGMVGMLMLKYAHQRWPLTFVVGMGDPARPLPRLLAAAGWRIHVVPFLFRLARPNRVLAELTPLRPRWHLRAGAAAARAFGLAWLGARFLRLRAQPVLWIARRLSIERIEDDYAFAVRRDSSVLEQLYPLDERGAVRFIVRDSDRPVGWAACLLTRMRDDEYFGNLTVKTVLDCEPEPRWAPAVAALAARELERLGADLVITNQLHARWIRAFHASGFLIGPSNYLFAASPSLAAAIGEAAGRMHVTRGDGDGRVQLQP
jgi:hypothetical protein